MLDMFTDELRTQREDAVVLLHQAERAGDEVMVAVLTARLAELAEIAERNDVLV
jgi:hypothetical protein